MNLHTRRLLATVDNAGWRGFDATPGRLGLDVGEKSNPQHPSGGAGLPLRKGSAAFTLVEVMIAAGILGLFVAGCLTAIVVDQICIRKAKEEAIAMDFLTKYVENIKGLPFVSVSPGLPINSIYNGAGGAALITIPANTAWVDLNTTNFQMFYPDLFWLSNRNPKMQVAFKQNSVAGIVHDKQINVKFDWDAPLARGGRLEVQVDFLRTVSVPTL